MTLDLVSLKLFIRVVEEGTISKAAQSEHIAAAAVSRRISELEHQLDTPLLHRTNKGVNPTQAGMELLYRARSLLNNVENIKMHIQGYSDGEIGMINIVANISSMSQELPWQLSRFSKQHPSIRFQIHEKNSLSIVYAIEKGQADIGIYTHLPHDADIETIPFQEDRLVLLAPNDHPLAKFDSINFEQCLDFHHVSLFSGTQISYQLSKVAMELNRSLSICTEVSSYETMCLLINAGMGIGILPKQSTKYYLLPNTKVIALKDDWSKRHLLLAVRRKNELSASAKLLLNFLQGDDKNTKNKP